MIYKAPVKAVPSELLYTGYCWETTREAYFARHNNWFLASDCRELRKLYAGSIEANAIHGSDSPENAREELRFFFSRAELIAA